MLDPGHSWRQVGLVDAGGATAVYTGADCSAWAGDRRASLEIATVLAIGNLLPGPEVLDAAVAAVVDGLAREGDQPELSLAALSGRRPGCRAGARGRPAR